MTLDRVLMGERVRHFRIQQGLTQEELAEMSGVSITTIYKVESGSSARRSSIEKICERGLKTSPEALVRTRAKTEHESYMLFRSSTTTWYAPIDRRRSLPEDNDERIQDPQERRRLGHLGFVPAFHSNPNIVMADGPGTMFIELHGRFEGPINAGVYRDCKILCQRGRARFEIGGETVELGPDDMLGCRDADIKGFEPAAVLTAEEPVPLLLYMGAVRVGKAIPEDGRRTIVRKARRATEAD